jgi:four helix bundle protein
MLDLSHILSYNIFMKENPLVDNSKVFAVDIINLCDSLKTKAVLMNQLLRSGTSIGANIREAQYAHGKKDFISKLEIALKECYETEYWLELLFEVKAIEEAIFKDFQQKAGSIRRLLIASCKTAKENN